MSTILNALKQAEIDSPDQGNENTPSLEVRTVLTSRIKQQKYNSFIRLSSGVILVALVITVAISFYFLLPINKKIRSQTLNTPKAQVLHTQPDYAKDTNHVNTESAIKPSDLTEASIDILPQTPTRSINRLKLPDKTILKPEPSTQVLTRKASGIKKNTPSKPVDPLVSISDAMPSLTVEKPTLNHTTIEVPTTVKNEQLKMDVSNQKILPLKNHSLKIQAIAWTSDPLTRIAVISDKVLNEGESVQGYRLVTIEQDSVILQNSGIKYRLKFKSQ